MMLATVAAVGVKNAPTLLPVEEDIDIDEDAIDITDQSGGDVVKKMVGDHDWHDGLYVGLTMTEAIIELGQHRVSKGWGCKHVGFSYNEEDGTLSQSCESACIWAGGQWRIN